MANLATSGFRDLLHELRSAPSLGGATQVLAQIGYRMECDLIAVTYDVAQDRAMRDETGEIVSAQLGWPAAMIESWENNRWMPINPMFAVARLEAAPFYWSKKKWSVQYEADRAQQRLLDAIYDCGVKFGICVPVHMPFTQVGIVSWASHSQLNYRALMDEYSDIMLAASHTVMLHARRLMRRRHFEHFSLPRLSSREIECLNCIAAGMTDKEVADRLSLSNATVRYHLGNAQFKLQTRAKAHTIGVAAQLGLLQSLLH